MDEVNQNISLEKEARSQNTSGERLQELAAINDNLALMVASNVAAPPELLKELGENKSKGRNIKQAVTSNPNTPQQVLLNLGEYFPQELLNNPIFELLVLEDLQFFDSIPQSTLKSILIQPKVPISLLKYAASCRRQDNFVNEIAKMHVAISGEMSEGWDEAVVEIISNNYFDYDSTIEKTEGILSLTGEFVHLISLLEFIPFILLNNLYFQQGISQYHKASPALLRQIVIDDTSDRPHDNIFLNKYKNLDSWYRNRKIKILENVAGNPNTPVEILELIVKDYISCCVTGNDLVCKDYYCSYKIIENVAGNPNTSVDTLKFILSRCTSLSIDACQQRILKNFSTPLEIKESILRSYAEHQDFRKREIAARHPNTPTDILSLLACKSQHCLVRRAVAENPNTPPDKLRLFLNDDYEYKQRVAKNPNTPEEILELLAKNSDSEVRTNVAQNTSTPLRLLQSLLNDSDPDVRANVAQNPNTPLSILKLLADDSSYQVMENVAKNPNSTVNIFRMLMANQRDSRNEVRRYIAGNANTPNDLLELLSRDSDSAVRCFVAKNPSTSIAILTRLASDRDFRVREVVLINPKCTQLIKEIIFQNLANLVTPSLSRIALFLSDYAKSSVLAENGNSKSWLERYAIAQNKKTPQETLQKLAQDGNRIVRATAKESLQK